MCFLVCFIPSLYFFFIFLAVNFAVCSALFSDFFPMCFLVRPLMFPYLFICKPFGRSSSLATNGDINTIITPNGFVVCNIFYFQSVHFFFAVHYFQYHLDALIRIFIVYAFPYNTASKIVICFWFFSFLQFPLPDINSTALRVYHFINVIHIQQSLIS